MMRSLYSGVSGLKNHQIKMDVTGNNIANVNTTAFKKSRTSFENLLSQNIQGSSSPQGNKGGINGQQVGLGVGMASIDRIVTQGNTQFTGKALDMAIEGDGYFVLQNGQNKGYSRAGTFDLDVRGNLVSTNNGFKVMGWQADANGILPNQDVNTMTGLQISSGTSLAAQATTQIKYEKNLNPQAIFTQGKRGEILDFSESIALASDEAKTISVPDIEVKDKNGNIIKITLQFIKPSRLEQWTLTVEPNAALQTPIRGIPLDQLTKITLSDETEIGFLPPLSAVTEIINFQGYQNQLLAPTQA